MPGLVFDLLARDKGASASVTRLGGAFDKAAIGQTKFNTSAIEAERLANKLRISELQVAAATERHTNVASSATASISRQASAEISLIRANEGLAAAQRETAAAAAASQRGASAMLAGTVKMAAGLGLVVGGLELGRKAVEFVGEGKHLTTSLNSVQAASRATNADMVGVRKQVIGMGKDLTIPGATAVDAADAIDDLVRAGVKLPRAIVAARPALLLAAAANVKTADSARVLGDVMDEFMLPATQAGKVANTLAAAANSAGGGLMDLFDGFKYAGPSARALHLSVDDTAASLVMLAKSGLQGSLGGTAFNRTLARLAPTSGTASAALKDLEVNAWNAQGRFRGLSVVFDQLHAAQERLSPKQFAQDVQMAFGDRAKNAVFSFAHGGAQAWKIWEHIVKTGDVQKIANQQNRGVAAGFRQLTKEATSAGIDVYQKLEPGINGAVQLVGKALPAAFSLAATAAHPFVVAWHGLGVILGPPLHLLGGLASALEPVGPVLGYTAAGVAGLWVAFKGYGIAADAASAIKTRVTGLVATTRTGVAAAGNFAGKWGGALNGAASASAASAAKIEAASLQTAAVQARAAAVVAVAEADKVAASSASTDAQVRNADRQAAAALASARTAKIAAAESVTAAETAAVGIGESGAAASIGWKAMLGPAFAIGITAVSLLAGMTHKNTEETKQATEAQKAYADAIAGADNVQQALAGTLTKQLTDNNVADHLTSLNKEMGKSTLSGKRFFNIVMAGAAGNDQPLKNMQTRLEAIIKADTEYSGDTVKGFVGAKGQAAQKALADLKAQYGGLTEAEKKAVANAKTFGQAATPIEHVSQVTKVGTETAKQYAAMVGLVADKSGVFYESQRTVTGAVDLVAHAYNTASQSTAEYLAQVDTFSKSAGTAADRAAIIGAMLKQANGDALGYTGAMASASDASRQFRTNVESAAKQVGKGGISTKAYLRSIIDLKTGTIDYAKRGAGPLVSDLQGMQTAAMNAAQATYQHARATDTGKVAADKAYTAYERMTSGALVKQARQLGLTKHQAEVLAAQYFGMPDDVKTRIEAAGTDPIISVLNKIGEQLSLLTHTPWTATLGGDSTPAQAAVDDAQRKLDSFHGTTVPIKVDPTPAQARFNELLASLTGHSVNVGVTVSNPRGSSKPAPPLLLPAANTPHPTKHAVGGMIHGPGTGTSDDVPIWASNGEFVVRETMTRKHRVLLEAINRDKLPAFAEGGIVKSGKGWAYDGHYYATKAGAENAAHRASYSASHHTSKQRAEVVRDFGPYQRAVGGFDVDATNSAYRSLVEDAKKAGVSRKALDALSRTEKTIIADLQKRVKVTEQVGKAQDHLNDLVSKAADLRGTVRGAFTGTFDITAGATSMFNDQPATNSADSILARVIGQAEKAESFRDLLTKLKGEGLSSTLLSQLAQAGPTPEAFAAAKALGESTPAKIGQISAQYARLDAAGDQSGAFVANAVFGTQISVAQALLNGYSPKQNPAMAGAVQQLANQLLGVGKQTGAGLVSGLLSQQKAAGNAAVALGNEVRDSLKHALKIKSPSRVAAEIADNFGGTFASRLASHEGAVSSASTALGLAAAPSVPTGTSAPAPAPHGGNGGGNTTTITHNWTINEADNGMDTANRVIRRLALVGP